MQLLLVSAAWMVATATSCLLSGPVDLGREFNSETLHWATNLAFQPGELQTKPLPEGGQYAINDFCSGEHTGTHLDAPFHFNKDGWSVEQIPLARLIANGVFLNVSQEAADNPDFKLLPQHLETWIRDNGLLPQQAVILISFGWAKHYDNPGIYFGTETNDTSLYQFPGLAKEFAERLLLFDNVVGVGVDTASIDPGVGGNVSAHVLLASRNIYNLENVDLDKPCLPARGFKVYSMPMKITNGTGAPCRIIAIPE